MAQLQLSNEENLHLNLISEKKKNLAIQDQLLTAEWNSVIGNFCKRNSQKIELAKTVDLITGTIQFEELKKNGKSKA